jgi:hypothetical protein
MVLKLDCEKGSSASWKSFRANSIQGFDTNSAGSGGRLPPPFPPAMVAEEMNVRVAKAIIAVAWFRIDISPFDNAMTTL